MKEIYPCATLSHGKSLLRVRGRKAVEEEIQYLINRLAQLNHEAQQIYQAAKQHQLVCKITYIKKAVGIDVVSCPTAYSLHVPLLVFSYWIGNRRKDIYQWPILNAKLDAAGVSLDERLLHMQIFLTFKELYYRSKDIVASLRTFSHIHDEYTSILKTEHLSEKMLTDYLELNYFSHSID